MYTLKYNCFLVSVDSAMTNYYENLDGILTVYRINYLQALGRENYLLAAHIAWCIQCAHPPAAKIEQMVEFVVHSNSLKTQLALNDKARRYCEKWMPRLEAMMSVWRDTNQKNYNTL